MEGINTFKHKIITRWLYDIRVSFSKKTVSTPHYKGKEVMGCLQDHQVSVLESPGNWPALNFIEVMVVWRGRQRTLGCHLCLAALQMELRINHLPQDTSQKLSNHILKHVMAVVNVCGNNIKYWTQVTSAMLVVCLSLIFTCLVLYVFTYYKNIRT